MPDKHFINRLMGVLLLVTIALFACAPKPETVAQKLVEAVNAQDVERALSLFAEDAVVDPGDSTSYSGTAEIRGWLEEMADANFQIKAGKLEVDGDTVVQGEKLSMDPWKKLGIPSLEGVRKIKVRDGHIESLEFSFNEASLSKLQTATLNATQPTSANLAYGKDSPEQVLDLYLPQTGNAPLPVILMIHGLGDEKESHRGLAGFFNQAGFAAVLIDYRGELAHTAPDALCALAWTRANAGKYGLDPDRITLFGYSVGGGIAATLGAMDDRSAALQGCEYTLTDHDGVLGVAVFEGILGTPEWCFSPSFCMDIVSEQTGMPLSELQPIFESLHTTEPARWKDAQAVGSQAETLARQFPLYWLDGSEPPFLVLHGASRGGIPHIESEAFVKWLQEAGVDAQLLIVPKADHFSIYVGTLSFPDLAGAVVEFAGKLSAK
jgi:acetyl esterase/lipase